MAKLTLKQIAKHLKGLDYCMMTTGDARTSTSRPMSNNGDVTYDGTSYYFTTSNTKKVRAIKKNPRISLQFVNMSVLRKNVFINIEAKAELITDRELMEEHWVPSLRVWYPDGLETRGLTMIKAKATRIHYWAGLEEGEYKPRSTKA